MSRAVVAILALAAAAAGVRADQLIFENFTPSSPMRDGAPIGGDLGSGGTNVGFGWFSHAITMVGGVPTLTDYTTNNGYNVNNPSYGSAGIIVLGATNTTLGNSTPCLAWTNTTVSLHDCTITNISFYTRNNSSNTTEQIALKIGGQWYASTRTFRDFTANAGAYALNSFDFTDAPSAWQVLNPADLTLGPVLASSLPSGQIEAVGLYGIVSINSGTAVSKIRLDNFSISGIPPGPPRLDPPTASPAGSVTAPTTVTLKVSAAGPGPFSYQWRKGGTALTDGPTGTGSTLSGCLASQLVISATSPADSGDYDVVVGNAYGSTTSSVVAITVTILVLPPSIDSIVTVPASGISEVGGPPMSLKVNASGTGPFSYQWRKNDVDLPGATGDTLTLASAFTNSGAYSVVVGNSVGSVTSSPPTLMTVVDTTPPVLTFVGGAVTNIARFTGYLPPTYTATDNSGEAPVVNISGLVDVNVCGTYVLTYTATDAAHNAGVAYYTVHVVLIKELFDEGPADNAPVGAAPGWSAFGYDVLGGVVSDYTLVGGNANLPTLSQAAGSLGADGRPGYLVSGDATRVNPAFIWLNTSAALGDHEITNITFFTKNNDSGSATYIAVRVNTNWYASTTAITDTTANAVWAAHSFDFDRAAASWQTFDPVTLTLGIPLTAPLPNYSVSGLGFFCALSSGKVRIDSLLVRGQPATFIPTPPVAGSVTVSPLNPADSTAWRGTPLSFRVETLGTAPLSFAWRKDGSVIPGATSNPWVLPHPLPDNSGTYDVIVSNGSGSSTSAPVTVTVTGLSLAMNEHFGQSTNDPGVIGQAPGWHALAINVTNGMVTDFTLEPSPPWNANFPNLARTAGVDNTPGYLVAGEGASANPVLIWSEAPSGLRHGQLAKVLFYTRNTFYSSTVQVVVRIGGQWYASAAMFQDTTLGAVPWQLHVFDHATSAGAWQNLDTNTLALGAFTTEPLPDLPVTGLGFYGDTFGVSGAKIRIDEVQVGVVSAQAPPAHIQPVYLDGAGNFVLRISTAADWDYVIEATPSLQWPVVWTPVRTNAGTGGVITNLIPVETGGKQFFRCRLQ